MTTPTASSSGRPAAVGLLVVALAAIAAATTLGALGDLSSDAVVAIISGSLGVVSGGAIATGAAASQAQGRSLVEEDHLRTLTDAAARRRATDFAPQPAASDETERRLGRIERALTAAALAREQQPPTPAAEQRWPPPED